MTASELSGGFADTVFQSQGAFRAIMQAMARPGKAQALDCPVAPPPVLSRELATVALTLCDHETRIWLAPTLRTGAVTKWLAFHAGAPVVEDPDEAAFAFADGAAALPPLTSFPRGTAEYPDRGATIVVGAEGLAGGPAVRLSGPGLEFPLTFAPAGLPAAFWRELLATRSSYPLGLDLLFVADGQVAGLPRSTRIEILET